MRVVVERKIGKDIKEASRQLGIREKELVDRALLLYLESIKKILDLDKEMKAWEALSDEALYGLARHLGARL